MLRASHGYGGSPSVYFYKVLCTISCVMVRLINQTQHELDLAWCAAARGSRIAW
jgi:hypothetical protein